jgi:lipopolysaccharide/colanic/teichoic acid biosynthesis glycosyltransferase
MENNTFSERQAVHIEMHTLRNHPILPWLDTILCRLLDIVISFLGLVLLAPFFLVIAAAIKHDSRGPVFYRGRRMGWRGKEFGILKFRTMYENEASQKGAKVTAQDDPRITPFGKWLRDTKINELPQLWNVFIGEMRLVGPRPEDPEIVEGWSEEDRQVILSIRPGITSPATIIYRDEEDLLSSANVMQNYLKEILPSKLRLDSLYVRNRTITTDLDVLFWTAIVLLPKMRKRSVPQHALYWGPISILSNRYLPWLILDSFIAFAAIGISGVVWRLSGPLDIGFGKAILYALGISLCFSLTNWALRLDKVEWSRAPSGEVLKLGISTMLTTLVVSSLNLRNPFSPPFPSAVILMAGILSLFGFIAVRYRERLITATGTRWLHLRGGVRSVGERVLLVGAGESCALTSWLIGHTDFGRAVSVVGIVDDDPRKQGLRIDGYDILGTTNSIPELVQRYDIGLIFYTINNIHPLQRARILSLCQTTGVRLVELPDIMAILRNKFKILPRPEDSTHPVSQNGQVDELLDNIQALLAENQVEAAQERLAVLRKQVYDRDS